MHFDMLQFMTALATVASTVSLVYVVLRNFREDFNKEFDKIHHRTDLLQEAINSRIDQQENRLFQLAMGKSIQDILKEEKTIPDKKSK